MNNLNILFLLGYYCVIGNKSNQKNSVILLFSVENNQILMGSSDFSIMLKHSLAQNSINFVLMQFAEYKKIELIQ